MEDRFFNSVKIFIDNKFSFSIAILGSFIAMVAMFTIWSETTPKAIFVLNSGFFFSVISFFLLNFVLRVSEVHKQTKLLSAEREGQMCKIRSNDLQILLAVSMILFVIMNLFYGASIELFFLLSCYIALFFFDFFIKDLSKNVFFRIVAKNPINLLSIFYFISIFSTEQNLSYLTNNNILLAVSFWLPTLAWEITRKIKSPCSENHDNTISKVFGARVSVFIPIICFAIQLALMSYIFKETYNAIYQLVICGGAFVIYAGYSIRFFTTLRKDHCKYLQLSAEAYIIGSGFIFVVGSLFLTW